jgi:predicted porin
MVVSQSYSDNIYLTDENKKEDHIFKLSPDFSLDFAVAPKNYFTLRYKGDFFSYANADNFKADRHLGSLSYTRETAKGSHFILGALVQDTAIVPFSETEQSKNYSFQNYFGDMALLIGPITVMGGDYSYSRRDFENSRFTEDNYIKSGLNAYIVYKRSLVFPLLIQYRWVNQDNNDQGDLTTDFKSHTVFLGGRWDSGSKLNGALRVGYTWAQFEQSDVDDFNGYAVDTNLVYDISQITSLKMIIEHAIQQPTRSARETGDFFEFTNTGLTITHKKWTKLTTELYGSYGLRDYKNLISRVNIREDKYYKAGVGVNYAFKSWISLSIDYHYQERDSDINIEDYMENLVTLSMMIVM